MSDAAPEPAAPRVVFLTACRNEEAILGQFLRELGEVVSQCELAGRASLWIVDDLSFDGSRALLERHAAQEQAFELHVVEVPTNLGNQGAMHYGLQVAEVGPQDLLITLDCDGEDDVREVPSVLQLARAHPGQAVLIERGRRKESLPFKLSFAVYKRLFRFLTLRRVIPNNFLVIPGAFLPAFRRAPLAAVHFAYAFYRLNPPHVATTRDRRTRYGGKSSQNLFMLVSHGLVGLMLFYEVVVARLLVLLSLFAVLAAGLIGAGALVPPGTRPAQLFGLGALGLGCAALGSLSLLVAASLALFFKTMTYRLSVAPAPGPASAGRDPA